MTFFFNSLFKLVSFTNDLCSIIPVLQSTSHHKIVMVSTCLNVNAISDKDEQPEPRTGFNTLNFYADEIDWAKIKEKVCNIKWKETLSKDPNQILETIHTLCFEICKGNVPTRTSKEGQKRSKVERHCQSLTKRRRKITKKLLHINSQIRKAKINRSCYKLKKNYKNPLKTRINLLKIKLLNL